MQEVTGNLDKVAFPNDPECFDSSPPAKELGGDAPRDKFRADEHLAVKLYDILQSRNALFTGGIFSDPAWTILLKLFISAKTAEPIRIAQIRAATDLTAAAAGRWMKILVQNGHVNQDGESEAAVFTLTQRSRQTLAALLWGAEDRPA